MANVVMRLTVLISLFAVDVEPGSCCRCTSPQVQNSHQLRAAPITAFSEKITSVPTQGRAGYALAIDGNRAVVSAPFFQKVCNRQRPL